MRTIALLDSALTIMLPCESAAALGVRAVVGPSQGRQIVAVLQAEPAPARGIWSARERRYRERIKGRDVLELPAVVRDAGLRAHERGLAAREQELYERWRRRPVCGRGHALGLGAEQAAAYVDFDVARREPSELRTSCGLGG